MTFTRQPGQMIMFSHIPKTAGQTLRHLLLRNLGLRHVDVFYRSKQHPKVYTRDDLRKDLRLYPWATSLAGHGPLISHDYGKYQDRLLWYTMLRDPVQRFLSQYQYTCQLEGRSLDFEEWAATLPRHNYQVRWVAGEQDVEAAKQIAAVRFQAVGLVEHFKPSLLIFRHRLGMPDFKVYFERTHNASTSKADRQRVLDNWDRYRDLVMEHNALDIELYNFVENTVWPRQVAEYGAERLAQDVETAFDQHDPKLLRESRYIANMAYRTLVYKPFVRIDKGDKLQY